MVYFAVQVILLSLLFFTLLPCRKMRLIPVSIALLWCSLTKYAVCFGKYLNGIIWIFKITTTIIIIIIKIREILLITKLTKESYLQLISLKKTI